METIGTVFMIIGALALSLRLMKIIDWFEPTSYSNTRRSRRSAR